MATSPHSTFTRETLELEILGRLEDAVVVLDAQAHVVFFNGAAERVFDADFTNNADASQTLWQLTFDPIEEAFQAACERVLATRTPESLEHRLGRGAALYETQLFPVSAGVCAVLRDFDRVRTKERKRFELALLESEERLRASLAAANIGTWRVDLRSGVDVRDATINAIFGLECAETTTPIEDFVDRVHPDDRAAVVEAIDTALRESRGYEISFRIVRPDGTLRWVHDVGRVLSDEQGPFAMTGATVDLTQTRTAEQAILTNERRYRSLALATHHLVWTTDSRGSVVEPQPMWCSFTGQDPGTAQGSGWLDAVHPDERAEVADSWARAVQKHRVFESEFRVRRHDDRYRHITMRAAPVLDDRGRLLEWIATADDVTERMTTEAQLQAVFDGAPIGIALLDRDLRFVHANRKMAELDGVPAGAHRGLELAEVDPAVFAQLETHVRAVLASGEAVTDVELSITTRGEPYAVRVWLVSFYPVFVDHEVTGAVAVALEITQRKLVEQSFAHLARTSRELASSLDLSQTVQNAAKAFTHAQAEIAAVVICDDMGLPPKLAGCAHVDTRELDRTSAVLREAQVCSGGIWRTIARSAPSSAALRFDHLTEESLQLLAGTGAECVAALRSLDIRTALLVPLVVQGRPTGAVLLARCGRAAPFVASDIPLAEEMARRAAVAIENARLFELSRREQSRVEEANRAKDEFLAVVSHELRTPLNAVLGWSKMLLAGTLEGEQRRRALETIERNARAQAQLIEDLLDISRIITGKLRIKLEPVDMVRVLEASAEVVRPAAMAKGVSMRTVITTPDAPLVGDAERLQQILWNLLSNAVKFTPKGGSIVATLEHTSNACIVSVEDSGQGIAPEFLPLVFDRFRQEGAGTTRAHGGLGLGLAIVRHLAELHGGTVRAFSDGQGRGANFVVDLPVAPANLPLPLPFQTRGEIIDAPPPSRRPSVAGIRALVVDDEPDARDLMETILLSAGAAVRTVSSAQEAMDELGRELADVIVSDIGMPHEDGYALIARIRALAPHAGGRIPAIALTAYARADDRKRALLAGFTMHMAKPVEPPALLAALATLAGPARAE